MSRRVGSLVTLLVMFATLTPSARADADGTWLLSTLKNHCVKCHGLDGSVEGDVDLLSFKVQSDLEKRPELLEELVAVLEDRQMPPEDEAPLPAATRERMVKTLRSLLKHAVKTQPFLPTPIRRMNRFQYNNAVVDLLELDRDVFRLNERFVRRRDDYFRPDTGKMPDIVRVSCRPLSKDVDGQRPEGFRGVAAFPQDQRAEFGFDNRADHLTLSPLLMESFLKLSQTIVESPDLNFRECRSWDRVFAPPGQPVRGSVEGRYEAEEGGPVSVVSASAGQVRSQDMKGWGSHWSSDTQLFWIVREADAELTLSFDAADAGKGLRFGFTKAPDYGTFELFLDDVKIGKTIDLYDPRVVRADDYDVSGLTITSGRHTLRIRCAGKNERSTSYLFGLDCLEVTGREARKKPESVHPTEREAFRARLAMLMRRAFRRPVEPETLNRFTGFAEKQLASGATFESTMRTVVGAILGMPEFLYLYETLDNAGTNEETPGRLPVDDFELVSRLAQFFWGSIPDDTLLDIAESGQLSDPAVLSEQIDRMLNDPRSSRFCDSFPGQWLQLDRLITAIPDPKKYPYFYYNGYRVSMHMMLEPLLLFETVYVEDRSVMDLLTPDFTWQSDMLRASYEGQAGKREDKILTFKRVALDNPHRGGVVTNAAVMTMTSTPVRTQPITRGAWVNSVIFNDPPEPPPADVPPLPEANEEALANLTIRERLAEHRKRADCAGCHDQIDPLGFALENFGPTGIWRENYDNGRKVDTSGVLFNQHKFNSLDDFKKLLVQEKRRFIRGFVAHLLSFGLGRELGPADSPTLDDITEKAMAGDDRLRTILKRVAMSMPFTSKNIHSSGR